MSFILIIILAICSGAIAYYCWANNFSTETIDIAYKAVGGSVIAIFFLIKGVWIDNQTQSPKTISTAFLHNIKTGDLRSFSRPTTSTSSEEMDMYKGINDIETLEYYEKFKSLNLKQKLANQQTNTIQQTDKLLLDELEFLLLKWASMDIDASWGIITEKTFSLSGYSGGGRDNVPATWVANIKIPLLPNEPNELLQKYELSMRLPAKSKITREASTNARLIKIITSNITFKISIFPNSGGVFDPNLTVATPIATRLGINNQDWWEHYHTFKFELVINPFTRYSDTSKAEQEWINRFIFCFEKNFSWDLFRKSLKT